jgi:hypothetical protein
MHLHVIDIQTFFLLLLGTWLFLYYMPITDSALYQNIMPFHPFWLGPALV